MKPQPDSEDRLFLISLIILALVVRFWGVSFGLPYIYHVDEARFVKIISGYLSQGDLNPHFFHVPSLYTYLVAALWFIFFLFGRVFGRFSSMADFTAAINQDPTVYYLIGRSLTVVMSVATVVVVYLIGKKMFNRRVGFIAGLFLIFSPEHNKISHYLNPDSPMVFFLVLSFFFIWLIYARGDRKFYMLAGLMAGLAMATKYGGQMLFLPLLLAHFFRALEQKRPAWKAIFSLDLILAGVFFLSGFLAGCPYAVLDSARFLKDFRWQSLHLYSFGHFGDSTAHPAWSFYFRYGFRDTTGPLFQFLVFAGVVLGFLRDQKKNLILSSLPLVLFFIIGGWKTRAVRYMLPLAPFFILIGAAFLDKVMVWFQAVLGHVHKKISPSTKAQNILAGAVLLIYLIPSVHQTLGFDLSISQKDTRTAAKEWVEKNIPRRTRIALESYCPPLSRSDYNISYRHALSNAGWNWLKQKKAEYVIISDIMYSRFTLFPEDFPREAAFYSSLDSEAILVKTFQPDWDEDLPDLHNPTIKIYRLRQNE